MRRRFLFLQGPHGPFFGQLAHALETAGAETTRVLFNRGDAMFWPRELGSARFTGKLDAWPNEIARRIDAFRASDLVLYGDTRPVHLEARKVAASSGVTVHVFEEGYLRPWWVTYERDGANGGSKIASMSADEIRQALEHPPADPVQAPEGWGALYRHMAYGAAYHAAILSGGPRLPSHRDTPVAREAWLHAVRLAGLPFHALTRRVATRALRRAGRPYHLVLLQLDHDENFRRHGPFPGTEAFLDCVLHGFAAGAPSHHLLVLKAHPLEDGRVPLSPLIRKLADRHGVRDRVRFLPGGKLGPLLNQSQSAVTVNSTAAQQALFRGLPVKAFGRAVYTRPEFVSPQPLPQFFASPHPPDRAAYADFRQFLLETSQMPGSFYSGTGRLQLCRRLPDIMLSEQDRYARAATVGAAARQHIRSGTTQI
ncbi:MAG: capsule biosynthesis protein CapA [Pseudomonadota bacterium]